MLSLEPPALFAIAIGALIALSVTVGFLFARWIYKTPKDAQNARLQRSLRRIRRRVKEGSGTGPGERGARSARRQLR